MVRKTNVSSRICLVAAAAGAAVLIALPIAAAGPAGLDPSFGSGGTARVDLGGGDHLEAVAATADGGIVAVGLSISASQRADLAVVRLRRDGTPNTSFGRDGRVLTDLGQYDYASDVAVQRDGAIVVAATATWRPTLLRYLPDGTLDKNFGTNGIVNPAVGRRDTSLVRVFVRPNGRILTVGYFLDTRSTFVLAQFTRNGAPDASFGRNGIVVTDVGTTVADAALGPGGTIVAAGTWTDPRKRSSADDFPVEAVVVRYKANGTLDRSFGRGGILRRDLRPDGCCVVAAVAVQPNGRILLGGYAVPGLPAVARLRPNGALDAAYGRNGMVVLPTGAGVSALALDRAGRALATLRHAGGRMDSDLGVVRLTRSGDLDRPFAASGVGLADLGVFEDAWALALQRDGRIVVAGYSGGALLSADAANDFAFARFDPR